MAITLSPDLEQSLQRAPRIAGRQNRKSATPEDLLLALIDDPDAGGVLIALRADCERLRRDVGAYMEGRGTSSPRAPKVGARRSSIPRTCIGSFR